MGLYKYRSVLLIDDSYIDNLITRKILEGAKFSENITVIDSAREAIDHLKELGKDDLPEIIFLDLRMPEMNGFEFLQTIREIPSIAADNTRIYVLSSSLDPRDRKRIAESEQVIEFISKPITAQVLETI